MCLSLGLRKAGNNIINVDYKHKKIKPRIPVKKSVPWNKFEDIAKISSIFLYFIGDHLFLIINGTVIYIASQKKKN